MFLQYNAEATKFNTNECCFPLINLLLVVSAFFNILIFKILKFFSKSYIKVVVLVFRSTVKVNTEVSALSADNIFVTFVQLCEVSSSALLSTQGSRTQYTAENYMCSDIHYTI